MNPSITWSYPLIMLASITIGVVLSKRTQKGLPLSARQRIGIRFGAFCGAMIGAKLPFVLADWDGLLSGLAWFGNGKTIIFGLVGGYFGVELAKFLLDVHVKTGDSFAVPIAASIAVGRLGCFVAGCCYGAPTSLPWGVDFGDHLRRHPTQVYESLFHLTAAIVLAAMQCRGLLRGQLVKFYIFAYLIYRFCTEWIRPEPILGLNLTGYQWACLGLIPVFILLGIQDARSAQPRSHP